MCQANGFGCCFLENALLELFVFQADVLITWENS